MTKGQLAPERPTYVTRLGQIMDLEGRKQSWLSERTGIDTGTLSRYVNGLHVPDDRKTAIAEALGRTVDDCFGEVQV